MLRKHPFLLLFAALVFLSIPACRKYYLQHPPAVHAGSADTITLPLDSVRLTGTASSPNGQIVTWSWSQLSGPSAATITQSDSPSTWVKALIAGSYTFQLTATDDKGITGSDTTTVLVNASPYHTLILQPNNNPFELQLFYKTLVEWSQLTTNSFFGQVVSRYDQFNSARGLIKFAGLDAVPSTATIDSAQFFLYSNPTPDSLSDGVHANTGYTLSNGFPNGFYLLLPTQPWVPGDSLPYGPRVLASPLVYSPSTAAPFLDLKIDVTALIAFIVSNKANNGFLLQMEDEAAGSPDNPGPFARIFVASHNQTYPDKHPKLIVYYH